MAPAHSLRRRVPRGRLWHLLDNRLVTDADAAGGLTPALHDRMSSLIQYAVDGGADAVQLSCSMYGPVAADAHRAAAGDRCSPPTRRCSSTSRPLTPERSACSAPSPPLRPTALQRLRRSARRSGRGATVTSRVVVDGRRGGRTPATWARSIELHGRRPRTELAARGGPDRARPSTRWHRRCPALAEERGRAGAQPAAPGRLDPRAQARRTRSMIALGCIADDFTGGTDVAAALRRSGLSVALLFGVPDPDVVVPDARRRGDRAQDPDRPGRRGGRASRSPRLPGCGAADVEQVYFKYCSTFDSTDDGNIGPVADALLEALGETMHAGLPGLARARPDDVSRPPVRRGRRCSRESSMRHHPLTPMTDANIARVLPARRPARSSVLSLVIRAGRRRRCAGAARGAARRRRPARRRRRGRRRRPDTVVAGGPPACGCSPEAPDSPVPSAPSLPARRRRHRRRPTRLPDGPAVVLAGSCSAATLAQVAAAAAAMPSPPARPSRNPRP